MKESAFQAGLIKEIKARWPGCYVLKIDPTNNQGFPDLLILHKNKWAALEVKQSEKSSHRPNQDYHIAALCRMSFASFIYPEVKEDVLNQLELVFLDYN